MCMCVGVCVHDCCQKLTLCKSMRAWWEFMNAHSVMCRLAWLNWIMLNLCVGVFETWEDGGREGDKVRMGGADGFRMSREGVWGCVLRWGGSRFALFSHFFLCRSTSECGHGYRSGQHWPHLWSQHGKPHNLFLLSMLRLYFTTQCHNAAKIKDLLST